MMFSEVVCDGIENGKGSEISMKGFAIKASMSKMISQGEEGDESVGVTLFLARSYKEKVLVIKEEVGSVEGFGGEAQE